VGGGILILYEKSTIKYLVFIVGVLLHEDRNYDDPLKHNRYTLFNQQIRIMSFDIVVRYFETQTVLHLFV